MIKRIRLDNWLLACTALASITIVPVQAMAQAAPADDAAQLGEIVVTAQKREQNVQDVPIAVTALTGNALVTNRVVTVDDLSGLAPGVTVRPAAGGSQIPAFSIRGVTSYGSVPGSDKEVSIYLDDVYISSTRGSIFDLPDARSIEVLRGPQGTLFGRNATAGAVSITTRDPNGKLGAEADFTIGNYDQRRERVTLNSPQVGPFSAYVTYLHNYRRGDVRNLSAGQVWDRTASPSRPGTVTTASPYLGTLDADSWFAALKFEPTDNFKMVYKFDHDKEDGSPEANGVAAYSPTGVVAALALDHPGLLAGPQRPDAVYNGFAINNIQRMSGHNLTSTWEPADNFTVKNVLAYRSSYLFAATSLDGLGGLTLTPADSVAFGAPASGSGSLAGKQFELYVNQPESTSKQWSDELQSIYHSRLLTLTTGLLWFHGNDYVGAPAGMAGALAGKFYTNGVIPLGAAGRSYNASTSLAAYGQAEFHVMPKLDLILGARITKDDKSGSVVATTDPALGAVVTTIVPFTYQKTKPNWLVGVNYKPTQDMLLYAKFSTAFVSGGSVASILFPPETATSWEAGLKAEWLDRHLRTNLAVYTVKYDNLQTAQGAANFGSVLTAAGLALNPPIANLGSIVSSFIIPQGGPVRAKGFEFEGTALFGHGLTAGGNLAYTDTTYSDVDPRILAGSSGEDLPALQPDWTGGVWGQFESRPFANRMRLFARLDASWHDKFLLTNHPDTVIPAYVGINYAPSAWILNGRVALENIEIGGLDAELAIWGKNLTQNRDITYALNLGALVSANYQQARTFGADLNLHF